MRLVLAALALVVFVAPAWAQSQYTDGEGLYVSFDEFRLRHSDGDVRGIGIGGEVGRRLGNGVDVGLVGSYNSYASSAVWNAGVAAGLTRPAPLGTRSRVRGVVSYGAARFSNPGPVSYDRTYATGDLSATLAKTVPVVGSVTLQPTVGVFGRVSQLLSADETDTLARRDGPLFDAGLQVELPIQFRLFGTDVALAPALRFSVLNGMRQAPYGAPAGSLRFNF